MFLLIPISETCEGDGNLDEVVDVFDLLYVLEQYGGVSPCLADVDADDDVDIDDVLSVLNNWGNCVGGGGPDSLEEELMDAGLPSDADDDYLYILQNGTQTEIDTYNCWVQHYLQGCNGNPLCGFYCSTGSDPWGGH